MHVLYNMMSTFVDVEESANLSLYAQKKVSVLNSVEIYESNYTEVFTNEETRYTRYTYYCKTASVHKSVRDIVTMDYLCEQRAQPSVYSRVFDACPKSDLYETRAKVVQSWFKSSYVTEHLNDQYSRLENSESFVLVANTKAFTILAEAESVDPEYLEVGNGKRRLIKVPSKYYVLFAWITRWYRTDFSHCALASVYVHCDGAELDLQHNYIAKLTLGGVNAVYKLNVSYNRLLELDCSNALYLRHLNAENNHLYCVTANSALYELFLKFNAMKHFSCIYFGSLRCLDISENYLCDFILTYSSTITSVVLSSNRLQQLCVSKCGHLEFVKADFNELRNAVFDECFYLKHVVLAHNNLCEFDSREMPQLSTLDLSDNPLYKLFMPTTSCLKVLNLMNTRLKSVPVCVYKAKVVHLDPGVIIQ